MTKQGPWHGATWEVGYQHLQAWVSEHGDANIPVDYVCDDSFRLGRWVNTQRVARRNGRLDQDRVALLEAVGLVWDPTEVKKASFFRALEDYVREHGNGDVPAAYRTPSGTALGNWARRQRALIAQGDCPDDVEALFLRLGISTDSAQDRKRNAMLRALQLFVEERGHGLVPHTLVTEDGLELGAWLANERSKIRSGRASREVRAVFSELGIGIETVAHDETWEQRFSALSDYRRRHGDADVASDYITPDGIPLGAWLGTQTARFRRGVLRPDRSARLAAVGVSWGTGKIRPSRKWSDIEMLAALRAASTYYFPLKQRDYQRLIDADEVDGPSRGAVVKRFGTWETACSAAGIEC